MSLEPATKHTKPISLIADLDALVSESVGFRLNGKTYVLKPVTAEELMKMEVARLKLITMVQARGEAPLLPNDEVYERYFEFINCIVDPLITIQEIMSMSVVQLNAVINLVFRQLAGDSSLYEKKNPQNLKNLRGL